MLCNVHSVSIQMAALSAGDHLAQCPLVLPLSLSYRDARGDDARTGCESGSCHQPVGTEVRA